MIELKLPCKFSGRMPNKSGYSRVTINGILQYEHRYVYSQTHGNYQFQSKDRVLHICDVPLCIEPTHLRLGTQQDNIADMVAKGRVADHKGEANPNSRLTKEAVEDVKSMHEEGYTRKEIAQEFGVSTVMVNNILSNKNWV